MSSSLRQIRTQVQFDALVATAPRPFLLDLGATWCGPCQRLTPVLEQFASDHADVLDVYSIDADAPRAVAWRLPGSSLPQMYLFDRGVIQLKAGGFRDRSWLEDVVASYPDLGVTAPDGYLMPKPAPVRSIQLPAASTGTIVRPLLILGDDDTINAQRELPLELTVAAGTTVRLMLDPAALDAGYLDLIDPAHIDSVYIMGGDLRPDHLPSLARLTCLRSLGAGSTTAQPEDLLALVALPLTEIDIGVPPPEDAFPSVMATTWVAPGLQQARRLVGLTQVDVSRFDDDPVDVAVLAKRQPDGTVVLDLHLRLASEQWYAYPPGSDEGLPVSLSVRAEGDWVLVEPLRAKTDDPHLGFRSGLLAAVAGTGEDVRLDVTVQVCDGTRCLPPRTYFLAAPVV